MTKLFNRSSVLFLLTLLASTAPGQQPRSTNKEELKRQNQRLQALSVIKQTAAEASLWDDKKAAVQVLADAADLLWDETPGENREWLRKAWDLIDEVSESPREEKLKEFFTRSNRTDLRTIVLTVARKHDAELAEKFLKELSQTEPIEKKDRGAFDDRTGRSEQLLQMAQQAIDSNPNLAFSLAERSLADGLSYTLQNVLTSLRRKNVDLANRLFDLALARFIASVPDPSEAQILAGYIFQPGFTFAVNSGGQRILAVNPAQQNFPAVASSEPQRTRSFLTAVYERLLTQPVALDSAEGKQRAQQILILGNFVARRYAVFAPELAPSAQGFLAQLQRQLMPDGETETLSETSRTSSESDTTKRLTKEELYEQRISELVDSADKESNALFRNVAYVKAALTTNADDYDRAKRIAEKIDDQALRKDAISFVLYRAALFFISKADVAKAIDIVPAIADPSRRAVVKIAIAEQVLSSKSDRAEPGEVTLAQQRALDLLIDTDRELAKGGPSAGSAKIMLGRTAVLAKLDKNQALTSLDQAVQMINKLDRFDLRNVAAPNMGMGDFSASGATVTAPKIGFDFGSAIAPLIDDDFEQITAIAGRLTSKELSGVARMEAAKLYLRRVQPVQ